ncbi:trihelix transcription factor ASR3 isoform X2 [Cynara cardunculus var. scolymus]|uniref:trihelix transcription factor ASR3 isoform X2 n=1 Tax=Cynara cardunculus var. scolymus TaxID=59895 RepID=UPI000D62EDA5|nr:trihelix transcription factor ASR3 isoform X2 [Cynara cardunculus var. scolymus]
MALERLTLAPVLLDTADPLPNGAEDINKPPRLPRWTRQELLVLIQGKRVAENRVRRGRTAVLAFGSSQVEPKWSSVSSYCKRHGVNRGPVQCRKRWSNLAGDFKKIKEWESQIKEEAESFWLMRNDLRRERKLPGFFDREVYDILDGGGPSSAAGDKSLVLSLAPSNDETENEAVFDSGRTAAADDGLFSDEVLGTPEKDTDAPTPTPTPTPISATTQDKSSIPNPEEAHEEGRKRKRPATDTDTNTNEVEMSIQNQLIEAMERNGRLLSSQLEIQNTNSQLDREQRKDHANSLFAVLNKLADAMVRIADKL